jgi:thermitase
MMSWIYILSYVALIGTAAVWLYGKARSMSVPFIGQGFWLSLITYLLSLWFGDAAWFIKLVLMFPLDIAVFVIALLLFNRFVSKSKVLFTVLAAVLLVVKFFVFDIAQKTYQKYQTSQTEQVSAKGELLADMAEGYAKAEFDALLDKYQASATVAFPRVNHPDRTQLDDYMTINLADETAGQWPDLMNELIENGLVDGVEANEVIQLSPEESNNAQPTAADYGLNDPGLQHLWGFKAMQMEELFKYLKDNNIQPKKVAKIAILDTGVDGDHEDIADNFISTNADYDQDKMGHGTHCAGIAAAVSNNGKGLASFSADNAFVKVTSIKVLSDWGGGTQQDVIAGIIQAADDGADVISMSLGGPSDDASQRAYTEAVQYANKAGAIVVVAAGNSDDNAAEYAPANAEGVITVSALDDQLRKAEFSNYITDVRMGIAAPGVNIYSTFPNNEYKFLSGTSMATPYVAGVLGLMKSLRPELTTEKAYQMLNNTGLSTPDEPQTGKLIQPAKLAAALQQAPLF